MATIEIQTKRSDIGKPYGFVERPFVVTVIKDGQIIETQSFSDHTEASIDAARLYEEKINWGHKVTVSGILADSVWNYRKCFCSCLPRVSHMGGLLGRAQEEVADLLVQDDWVGRDRLMELVARITEDFDLLFGSEGMCGVEQKTFKPEVDKLWEAIDKPVEDLGLSFNRLNELWKEMMNAWGERWDEDGERPWDKGVEGLRKAWGDRRPSNLRGRISEGKERLKKLNR
ncbi:MAG: hypothetical protein M0R06_17570 [Sphaerochaeta sp.]|jgi:hypothetical protein|nr:hypothetical protein [Sphaerochaeta sp.]